MQMGVAVALAVSSLPQEQRKAGLQAMLEPVLTPLQQLVQQLPQAQTSQQQNGLAPSSQNELILALTDRLTVVFRYMRPGGQSTEWAYDRSMIHSIRDILTA